MQQRTPEIWSRGSHLPRVARTGRRQTQGEWSMPPLSSLVVHLQDWSTRWLVDHLTRRGILLVSSNYHRIRLPRLCFS